MAGLGGGGRAGVPVIPPDLRGLRTCFNASGKAKRSYPTRKLAQEAADRAQADMGSKRRPFTVYGCELHGFHVAHALPKGKRARAR